MTALERTEGQAMAIPFPAPEAATEDQCERVAGDRAQKSSLIVNVGHILRRCYERVCSAIFDPDGDCMRF
jgi:hypothetical protein